MAIDMMEMLRMIDRIHDALKSECLSIEERMLLCSELNSLKAAVVAMAAELTDLKQGHTQHSSLPTWSSMCAPALPPPRSANDQNVPSNVVYLDQYRGGRLGDV